MHRRHTISGLGLIVLLSPLITWWLVGDLSETLDRPDYVFHPPNLTSTQELILGASATSAGVLAAAALLSRSGRRNLRRTDAGVAGPLVALGAFLGCSFRVVTAGVGGANIGAGLVVMFGLAFVPASIATAVINAMRARHN